MQASVNSFFWRRKVNSNQNANMSQSKGSQIWDLRNYKATYYKSSKINSESPKYTAKVKQREK